MTFSVCIRHTLPFSNSFWFVFANKGMEFCESFSKENWYGFFDWGRSPAKGHGRKRWTKNPTAFAGMRDTTVLDLHVNLKQECLIWLLIDFERVLTRWLN